MPFKCIRFFARSEAPRNVRFPDRPDLIFSDCEQDSPGPPQEDDIRTNLTIVHTAAEPEIDLVAVHGWKGHPQASWTSASGVNWLRDMLAQDMPKLNIHSWGYSSPDSSCAGREPSMQALSQKLVSDLWQHRENSKTHELPLVFIAHSAGGSIVKGALLYSASHPDEKFHGVKRSTCGVLYMGTPELDARLEGLASYLAISGGAHAADDAYFKEASWLLHTLRGYEGISQDFRTVYGHEQGANSVQTHVEGTRTARHIYLNTTHDEMNKYDSALDPGYENVRESVIWIAQGIRKDELPS
ncbi:hypothetical protein ASPACDRAFT_127951 [Aspergillus aculeatus ATCC 16872]|uniref:DUF676 domain-containing protein n=1 Tax=Aspergillus aculeatus (strain ATCC 16872 / CBS 172.66 / WB 5094) TaxID=690307 RepID=A0A1L9WF53_ASPA1|nr:uncharacterized protein ASPACDRAFT_127951 [Aspergillus aculeatus ATCC 16872]OJJ94784.1 hypothetical protein ASPACDRAFT_127951 [Aspergillus aculeatus ATCC 16872]